MKTCNLWENSHMSFEIYFYKGVWGVQYFNSLSVYILLIWEWQNRSPPCFLLPVYISWVLLMLNILFWTHLILDDGFQTEFSLLLSAVAVYKQEITVLRKVLTLCNYRLYVNWHICALSTVAIRVLYSFSE